MSIDFEKDQENVLQKTGGIQSLADQVERLEGLQKRLELQEENIKNTKKELEHVSGEIIPYLADLDKAIIFLVRLALGFLIVVDSSIAIKALCDLKNLPANNLPLSVLKASTFIIKI
jgi:hypothetical protein